MVNVIQIEAGIVRNVSLELFSKQAILNIANDGQPDGPFSYKHIHVVDDQQGIVACSVLHDNGLAMVTYVGDAAAWQSSQVTG